MINYLLCIWFDDAGMTCLSSSGSIRRGTERPAVDVGCSLADAAALCTGGSPSEPSYAERERQGTASERVAEDTRCMLSDVAGDVAVHACTSPECC